MTVEEFINEKLCPAGVVTVWDETVIRVAYRLGDRETLKLKLEELAIAAGVEWPSGLTFDLQ